MFCLSPGFHSIHRPIFRLWRKTRLVLGDIVINAGRVKSQAAEYGHRELREFAFLIAHSTLHLCGYDHMTEEEAKDMESRQTRVLNQLGITREV